MISSYVNCLICLFFLNQLYTWSISIVLSYSTSTYLLFLSYLSNSISTGNTGTYLYYTRILPASLSPFFISQLAWVYSPNFNTVCYLLSIFYLIYYCTWACTSNGGTITTALPMLSSKNMSLSLTLIYMVVLILFDTPINKFSFQNRSSLPSPMELLYLLDTIR